jgi:hypothetical protein
VPTIINSPNSATANGHVNQSGQNISGPPFR